MPSVADRAAPAIVADGLVKRFGGALALDGVSLAAPEGSVLCLLGPNGAGKTTVVRTLTTLLPPDSGRASVAGYDVVREAGRVRAAIGVTGQFTAVDDLMTGTQNLVMVARLGGFSRQAARSRAAELLDLLGLSEAAGRLVRTYSGGMRRRLDLAACLVRRPRVLFLDEPTTGLDPRSRGELWSLVLDVVAKGTTVLLTTQYLEEADRLADDVVVLDRGRVVVTGPPRQLKQRVGGHRVEFHPPDRSRADAVARAATALTGRPAAADGDVVRMNLDEAAAFPDVARRLMDAGLVVGEISLGYPSLDEVFLALTGRPRAGALAEGAADDAGH
ncbi:ATP-binding cassette domain-containing protein [Streptomyces bambusae]|uniref:ATP-binding cassette domain-containing protein n=1 Tax=Streptomyces bambusae TaxID=1550616 RepID=A0ABS6YY34_9ACTN|nr:ATP-binding cassette domain-containing protein [Streptomyces bambusae]MBW5480392.1 ATP-binding cassette domain-containing protein [Streptomyces bambusae]